MRANDLASSPRESDRDEGPATTAASMPKATLSLLPKFRLPAKQSDTSKRKKPLLDTPSTQQQRTIEQPPPSYESLYAPSKTDESASSTANEGKTQLKNNIPPTSILSAVGLSSSTTRPWTPSAPTASSSTSTPPSSKANTPTSSPTSKPPTSPPPTPSPCKSSSTAHNAH